MSDWDWTRVDEIVEDPRVERQMHEFGCGAACAVMLLRDRDIAADQLIVAAGLHLPSTAEDIATRLNQFADGHRWVGGALSVAPPLAEEHLRALSSTGSWAALLVPERLLDGHWVVIDGVSGDGTAAVRDPSGSSYRMPVAEMLNLMRFMVVVVQVA